MAHERFRYSGKTYIIIEEGPITKVYRSLRGGLKAVEGQQAFQVILAFRRKQGEKAQVRRPRIYAKRARKRF
jgi:hypothetical protein